MHMAPYFTAFGLLTVYLAVSVIRLRMQHRVSFGTGGHHDLDRANRVFGNFIEYAPMGLVLLIGLEFVQAPVWYMHLCGLTLLAGRLLHAYGLGLHSGISRPRFIGMILTFFSLAVSAIGVSLFSFLMPVV